MGRRRAPPRRGRGGRPRARALQPGVAHAARAAGARDRGAAPPSHAGHARRRRPRGGRARGVGVGHDARGGRPRRGRHAHAADRRLVDDPHDRRPGRRGSTRRGATRPERAPRSAPSRPRSTVGTSGRGGRRTTITGSPRSRATSSLASVCVPPLSLVTTRSIAWRSTSARSPSTVYGPRSSSTSWRAGSGGPGGSTQRTRNHVSSTRGERGEPLAAGGQQDATAEPRDRRRGLVEVGDPRPAVAGALAPRRALQAQQRHAGGRGGARRAGGDALGERVRRVHHGRDLVLGQPPRERVRAAEPADADRAGGQARIRDAAGERRRDRDARRVERGRERAGLRRAAENQDHAITVGSRA